MTQTVPIVLMQSVITDINLSLSSPILILVHLRQPWDLQPCDLPYQ